MSSTLMGCIPPQSVSKNKPFLPYVGFCQTFSPSNEKIIKTTSVTILYGQSIMNIPKVSRMFHHQILRLSSVIPSHDLGPPSPHTYPKEIPHFFILRDLPFKALGLLLVLILLYL